MTARANPIDNRPFRSKAEHLLERNLEAQYRGVAIPQVVAALQPRKDAAKDADAPKSLSENIRLDCRVCGA